jgi:hypothetical protein
MKQLELTFSQIKAWYRSVATFIAVGGVPTDTVGDVPMVVGVPAVVCISAVACIPALVVFFLAVIGVIIVPAMGLYSCRIDNFSAFGLSGYRISDRRFEKLSDYRIKA